MKYFTPELFGRLQECGSPSEFSAINAKWESAVQKYGKQLKALAPRATGGVRQFVRHGSLHDARVIAIGTGERTFTIVVQEELVPTLLSLTYSLVDDAFIERDVFAEPYQTRDAVWLYDELEMQSKPAPSAKVRRSGSVNASQSDSQKTTYRHSILLSNGWEIRLRFHRLSFVQTNSLLERHANTANNSIAPYESIA